MIRFDADYIPRSAMAIYAHPDDIEFTVSGTVAKWADAGCNVTAVLITSGDSGTHEYEKYTRKSLARVRERESKAAAKILGISRIVFLRKHDCEIEDTMALRKLLVRQIRKFRPEVVLCGDPQPLFFGNQYINHPDHIATAKAALGAVFPACEMELLWPELGTAHKVHAVYISSAMQPNTWIDITGTIERKIESLRVHKSQLGDRNIAPMIYARASGKDSRTPFPKRERRGGAVKYAESFRVMRLLKNEPTNRNNTGKKNPADVE
ncbi:MAG: PIG-L family deacetylase [Syntrophorhabdaceae bacterium]|nr:PIG-L family deacetylase [Syntrophorhabdaceae bacterium]